MKQKPFGIGDRLDPWRWDTTMPPNKRANRFVIVLDVFEAQCQSGWMVRTDHPHTGPLDSAWFTKAIEQRKT
jgi:hypothetical protein